MPLYIEAIRAALRDALLDDERVFLLGEDIGHFGGAFGVTKGLWEEFGDERVLDTPISEEGFVGAAIGAAWQGERPIVELQFADFVSCAFDDDDPVLFFEHKGLYRTLRGEAPDPSHRTPLGKGYVPVPGTEATVVTYGAGVDLAMRAAAGLDVEILDLRTVWPFDGEAVL